jgi:hypothetical protein
MSHAPTCHRCHRVTVPCQACNGDGSVALMFGHCSQCDGTGYQCPRDGHYWH